MPLNAGDLRQRIVVQSPSAASDAFGQTAADDAQGWTTAFTVWAMVRPLNGKDVYALGAGFTSQVTHKVSIRWPGSWVTSQMRIQYDGRTFKIQAVSDPDEKKRQLDLICMELNT